MPEISASALVASGVAAAAREAPEVIIVTNKAMEIEPAIWRKVVFVAVPCAKMRLSRLFNPQVVNGIVSIVVPTIRIVYHTQSKTIEDVVLMVNIRAVPIVITAVPTKANGLGPKRSKTLPVTGLKRPVIKAPGSMIRPEMVAASPRAVCTNCGTRFSHTDHYAKAHHRHNGANQECFVF